MKTLSLWIVRDLAEIEVAVDTAGNAYTLDGRSIELTLEEQEEARKIFNEEAT